MTFAAVKKILKVCKAAMILNYSDKREKNEINLLFRAKE